MTLYHLMKDGERSATARPAPAREGDERSDEERVLDSYPGFTVAFTLDRDLGSFEKVDEAAQAIVLDVAALDAYLHGEIDAAAGAFRCQFITDVPGQELTYLRKEAEARDQLAGGAGPWPMLEAAAEALERPIAELAAEIVVRADAWTMLGAAIEGRRLAAKAAVRAAGDKAGKEAAAEVDWAALLDPDKPVPPQGGQGQG